MKYFKAAIVRFFMLIGLTVFTGCSSTPADLEAKTTPVTQNYPENYQEIYRRVAGTAKRCFTTSMGAYASMAVDSEIYSELGYGEISLSLINMGTRNYYLMVRVEKQLPGSRLTVRSGNTLASERYKDLVLRWAGGDQNCPAL
jgi:hypothetical protein